MKKICIIEDNEKLKNELLLFFKNNGYEAFSVDSFGQIPDKGLYEAADLILLDLNLPGADGHHICRKIRQESDIPIIIMTSRNTELDELLSMNLGADDFVTKPFNIQILLARVENIFKRIGKSPSGIVLDGGDFVLDVSRSILRCGEEEVELTKNEQQIAALLLENRGKIVSRDVIMSKLWDSELYVDDNTLTVNINRLRKKLESAGLPERIQTKRGQGYLLP